MYCCHDQSSLWRNVCHHITQWQLMALTVVLYIQLTNLPPDSEEVCANVNTIPHKQWCGLLFVNHIKEGNELLIRILQCLFIFHIHFL